ncbi:MAG TPA: queuosine precursor transporter [Candidatus Baltobacteraceae bacterium]|nr:queuosine precursor transporter [Candidatus Baltobacteraceae bacterium]
MTIPMNEQLFLAKVAVEFLLIYFAYRAGKEWLILTVPVNLILIGVLGAKVIMIFGLTTNATNAIYAAVFLAIQLLVERYGRKEGVRATQVGFAAMVTFAFMAEATQLQIGTGSPADAAIATLFGLVPRIAGASILAFLAAQLVNVELYDSMRARTGRRYLWVRSFMATVAGQLVDSVLFFFLAFSGTMPPDILLETMIIGFLIKTAVGVLGIPLLYATRPKIEELI